MVFIALLILTTVFIAGAAAFFSVYGLAATFSGTFWSVVLMGASLEAAKLVAASYLYRYWTKINIWLKSYLMAGVAALMVLTSTGIFGYLSSGYQTDALPLKQIEEQVKILDEEKVRLIARKNQIDVQISQLPTNSVRGRTALIKGFKDEQASVTLRISELDKTILENKTKLIQTQAHVGPITYIASAFGLDTDNATKYLIYLIIFAFDPMAISLTLAVNIAIRLRQEELDTAAIIAPVHVIVDNPPPLPEPIVEPVVEPEPIIEPAPVITESRPIQELPDLEWPEVVEPELTQEELNHDIAKLFPDAEPVVEDVEPIERPGDYVQQPEAPVQQVRRRTRPYNGISGSLSSAKLDELVQHYRWLKDKQTAGEDLTQDDRWELSAIEDILRKNGLGLYIS
jgi:hypothetical protein